jgi:hypothetical protein
MCAALPTLPRSMAQLPLTVRRCVGEKLDWVLCNVRVNACAVLQPLSIDTLKNVLVQRRGCDRQIPSKLCFFCVVLL